MGISDRNNVAIPDSAAVQMRWSATQRLLQLPAQLYHMAVGLTWERSAEQSMEEYRLLDLFAQSIDILKAMNIRDRDQIRDRARRIRKEQAPGVLRAVKYWVCPGEMQKTRHELQRLRERGCSARCVEDCMRKIESGTDMRGSGMPSFVYTMKAMESIMNKARATAIRLQAENPDGHWAVDLLGFYADGWLVWLDEFNKNFRGSWCEKVFDEKMEGAKERAKVANEIVEEVKKEKQSMTVGS